MSQIVKDSKLVMKTIVDIAVKNNSLKDIRADTELLHKILTDSRGPEYLNLLFSYLCESGYITSIPKRESKYNTDVTAKGVNFAEEE